MKYMSGFENKHRAYINHLLQIMSSYEWYMSSYEWYMNNSAKNVGAVNVVNFCTSSGQGLY